MADNTLSARTKAALASVAPLKHFLEDAERSRRLGDPDSCDFTTGNSHDAPLPEYVEALVRRVVPENRYWYAYKMNEPKSRAVLAESLREWRSMPFQAEDILVTNGAIAALHVVFGTIINPGDEVIFISPPWFMYEGMILLSGGVPVRVRVNPPDYDLDPEAIARAISPRTCAVIVNSPHNPTGKIYPPATLASLAELLAAASQRNGRPIHLISDESYSRILFDGRAYHSPTEFYPHTFLVYTYGKVLLAPGQRLGFIALPPAMPGKVELRNALESVQMLSGWAFPNALLQHALADIDPLSIDIPRLERRRNRLVPALRDMGYETSNPEGTFYMLVRSPLPDDQEFVRLLAKHDIFCVPGAIMDIPGQFRLSLTANDEMIERSLPRFAAALRETRT